MLDEKPKQIEFQSAMVYGMRYWRSPHVITEGLVMLPLNPTVAREQRSSLLLIERVEMKMIFALLRLFLLQGRATKI